MHFSEFMYKCLQSLDVDDSKVCVCVFGGGFVCVKQRHVSLVKAVVLSGAEGRSEA